MDNPTSNQGETIVITNGTTKQECPFCDEQLSFIVRDVASDSLEDGRTEMNIWFESTPASTQHVYEHEEAFKDFPQRYIPLAEEAEAELRKAGLHERVTAEAAEAVAKFARDAQGQQLVQDIHDRKAAK